MITMEDSKEGYKKLWMMLFEAYDYLISDKRRFCPRNIIRLWLVTPEDYPESVKNGERLSRDLLMMEICRISELEGFAELPNPRKNPLPSRELLKAVACVWLHRGPRGIKLRELDGAYQEITGKRLDVSKKGRT